MSDIEGGRGLNPVPSGQHAWNQLLDKKRRRSKGSLDELARQLWYDIAVANAGTRSAMEQADAEEVRRWLHIKQRLQAIEQRFDDGKTSLKTNGARRNGSW